MTFGSVHAASAVALGFLLACGSPAASFSLSGTVGGRVFYPVAAEAAAGGTAANNTGPAIEVSISNSAKAACSTGIVKDSTYFANATSVNFALLRGGSAITTGTYTVGGEDQGPKVLAQTVINDTTCNDSGANSATSGTVTILSLSSTQVSGSYNLRFGTDQVSGSFNLPLCSIPAGSNDARAATCQ